jgi:hypothetical protein
MTYFFPLEKTYHRPIHAGHEEPLRASYLRNIAASCNAIFARGRFQTCAWLGFDQSNSLTFSDQQHETKITPAGNTTNLKTYLLCRGVDDGVSDVQVVTETSSAIKILEGPSEDEFPIRMIEIDRTSTGGTQFDYYIKQDYHLTVVGICVFDKELEYIDLDSDDSIDIMQYERGKVLTASAMQDLINGQRLLLSDYRKVLVNNSSTGKPLVEFTTTDGTYKNVMDGTSTAWSATAPGYWISPSAVWNGQTKTKLKISLYASMDTVSQTALVQIRGESDSSDELTVNSTTPTWYTGYMEQTVPSDWDDDVEQLIQVFAKGSGGAYAMNIHAICVEEEDTRKARPRFRALAGVSSAFNLDSQLTINGTTVIPVFRYKGEDATISTWPKWGYGSDLDIAGSGSDPTPNNGTPLIGSIDDSVLYNNGKYHNGPSNSYADITTEDIWLECVIKTPSGVGDEPIIYKTTGGYGYYLLWRGSLSMVRFLLYYGAGNINFYSPVLAANTVYYLACVVNRDEASVNGAIFYANAIAGTGVDPSAAAGTLASAMKMRIGLTSTVAIHYMALFLQNDWYQAGAAGPTEWATIAKERFHRLIGFYPQIAKGTADPTVAQRATSAYLSKLESGGATKLYLVGDEWLRLEKEKDDTSTEITGYKREPAGTNICLQSTDFTTTWGKINGPDTVTANALETVNREVEADSFTADTTSTQHGVTQVITLTAATYVFSVYAKKGDKDWLYLADSTVANCYSYFDLNNGATGTKGAGASVAGIKDMGDGWYRCWIVYTGTVAAHTHQIYTATADTVNTFAGDGSTKNTYVWGAQVELGNFPSSHIRTTTTSATRNKDELRYKGDDGNLDTETGDGTKGSIYCKILCPDRDNTDEQNIVSISDGGAPADMIDVHVDTDDYVDIESAATAGNAGAVADGTTDVTDNDIHQVRATWKTDLMKLYIDESAEGTNDTSVDAPDDKDRIDVGQKYDGSGGFMGIIKDLRIYDTDETDYI